MTDWPPARPLVILLNGPSSAGKTTIARTLHGVMPLPTMLLLGDDLRLPRPSAAVDWLNRASPESVEAFRLGVDNAYYSALASFRESGFFVIGEVGIRDQARRSILIDFLTHVPNLLVRVTADLPVLVARERARGDRPTGIAAESAQLEMTDLPFDLTLDTSSMSPSVAADRIVRAASSSLEAW